MSATAFAYAERAGTAIDQGHLRAAARLYSRAIRQFPHDPPNPETVNDIGQLDTSWPVYWEAAGATCLRTAIALSLAT